MDGNNSEDSDTDSDSDHEMDAEYVRLRGTYNGQQFDVTVPVNAELELALNPPLSVTASSDPVNVSVAIQVADWFRDRDGNVIDPRQLQTNVTLRSDSGAAFVHPSRRSRTKIETRMMRTATAIRGNA